MGGRYILAQAVLQQMTVYWAHLYFLPFFIIKRIKSIMAQFIWSGSRDKHKYHLIKLEKITIPKEVGGWGWG